MSPTALMSSSSSLMPACPAAKSDKLGMRRSLFIVSLARSGP